MIAIAAGDLDRRVIIQQATESVDSAGYGDATPSWADFPNGKVWAKIDTGGSREFYRASQTYTTMTHLVTVRYRPGLTTRMRLSYRKGTQTRYLNITGIINSGEADVELQLACSEAQDGVTS